MKKIALLFMLSMLSLPSYAITVLTSIKPIQMITTELMLGVGTPEVLVPNNASPHDYALRPSDVKRISHADLVIWYGHDLESFLEKIINNKGQSLEISVIEGLALRPFDEQ